MKTARQLERYFKGASNHWRIAILRYLSENKNASLDEISKNLSANIKTASGHTRRLVQSGLLNKRYRGRKVMHELSPYGKKFVKFFTTF